MFDEITCELKCEKFEFKRLKRFLDIICALMGILFFSPLFIIIAIMIKLTTGGKVIFRHRRVGYMGQKINVYKFRTMIENAEGYKVFFNKEQTEEFEKSYKLKNDPRVTPIGNFLRRSSLDELPQLFNVLFGSMSLVGPRPVTQEELIKYGNHTQILLCKKPGITGLWQVNGRSDSTYEERVRMDIEYIKQSSILLDIKIILKTVVKVLIRDGAY